MSGRAVRIAGPLIGVAGAVAIVAGVGANWGFLAGAAFFVAVTTITERFWRRRATADEIRTDLEDRVRNPPA